jgi:hypothetical protein
MKGFLEGWRLAAISLAVALLVGGIAFGACVATEEVEEQESEAPATATSAATVVPTATPTAALAATPALGALSCPDCPVKADAQLEVTAADIQLGKEGKYFIPDRGDGCAYVEIARSPATTIAGRSFPEQVTLQAEGCELMWDYEPSTGDIKPLTP